jgi:pantoate--beta-alanine ligase
VIVARTRVDLAEGIAAARQGGRTLGLVPTMGYLHEGHLSLVDRASRLSDAVAVSLFVNPLQFGPSEDLDAYPRDEEHDLELLEARGAELVFAPTVDGMYPAGSALVTVSPGPMGRRLCGAHRPGHFSGVLTVVAKLFGLFRPEVAVFGQKDFQQAVLIRRMVADLDLGVSVHAAPIVREPDGLAMSSRNAYLTAEERTDAVGLVEGLRAARALYEGGQGEAGALLDAVRARIAERHRLELQYAEVVDPETLDSLDRARPGAVMAVAAFCGTTRLIDNMELR